MRHRFQHRSRRHPARLRQVFQNVPTNAIKVSHADDPIRVTATLTETDLTVTVRDRGLGVDAATVRRLFDLFTRHSTTNGLGSGWPSSADWSNSTAAPSKRTGTDSARAARSPFGGPSHPWRSGRQPDVTNRSATKVGAAADKMIFTSLHVVAAPRLVHFFASTSIDLGYTAPLFVYACRFLFHPDSC
jgi:hypothetical protein